MTEQSDKLKLNKEDMTKLGKSLAIGVAGFVLAFCVDAVPTIDFGQFSSLVYSLAPVVANLLRKWIPGN